MATQSRKNVVISVCAWTQLTWVTTTLQLHYYNLCSMLLVLQYRKAYFSVKAENEELKMQIEELKKKLASLERRATYKRH